MAINLLFYVLSPTLVVHVFINVCPMPCGSVFMLDSFAHTRVRYNTTYRAFQNLMTCISSLGVPTYNKFAMVVLIMSVAKPFSLGLAIILGVGC